MSENLLLEKAKKGNKKALEQLLYIYQTKVYSTAIVITRNQEEALDLAQETYITVCEKIAQCKSFFLPWTLKIMKNLYIDGVRKKRLTVVSIPLDEMLDVKCEELGTAERVEANFTRDVVLMALSELPESYRIVLTLRHLNDLSISEISEILDIKEGTIKSQLHRGRELLKSKLILVGEGGDTNVL